MDEVYSTLAALLFLTKETIAHVTDANVFARLPNTRCDVLGVFGVKTNSKGFLLALPLSPEKSVEHTTEFPIVV